MTAYEKEIFNQFLAAGYTAFFYPRKGKISISGKPLKNVKVAIDEMKEILNG